MMRVYHRQWTGRLATLVSFLLLCGSMAGQAYAEPYIGGQFGMALPSIGGGLKDIETTTQFLPGTKHSDLTLSNSAMGGLKAGYFFRGARWFGLEGEFYATSPHIQQQTHTFTNPSVSCSNCTGMLQGAHFRVYTLAPLNLMFRVPGYRLQPYIGIGPALYFARISGENISSPSTSASTSNNGVLGFNGKVGVEYFFTKHFTAFAEWRYNYAQFNFKENANLFPFPYGFKTTYTMNFLSFGLAVHF